MLLWCSLYHHFCSGPYIRVIYWIRHISFSLCRVCCEWYCGWQWLASPRISLQPVSQWGSAGSSKAVRAETQKDTEKPGFHSAANGIENRKPSSKCLMLDVSPQTLQFIDKKKKKSCPSILIVFSEPLKRLRWQTASRSLLHNYFTFSN